MNDSILPPEVADRLSKAGLRVVPAGEYASLRGEVEALRASSERVHDVNEFLVRGTRTACASVEVRILQNGGVEVLAFDSADMSDRLRATIVDAVVASLAPNAGSERLLTKRELAEQLGISTAQIDRNVRAGMPVERAAPRSPRYDLAAVRAWMKNRARAVRATSGQTAPSLPPNVRRLRDARSR